MKAKTLLLSAAVVLTGCSEDSITKSPSCTAVINGLEWNATSFQSNNKIDSGPEKTIESITAIAEDGTSIVFNIEVMGLTPAKLSAEFRSKSATISYFTASLSGSNVDVRWGTSSESNVYYFDVERSYDNIYYQSVGLLTSYGNSSTQQQYALTVSEPRSEDYVYFRLRIVDYNWNSVVTDPVEVKLKHEVYYKEQFMSYPGYDGKVQLTEYNEEDKTISGNFSFKYLKDGREIQVVNGVIANVPY